MSKRSASKIIPLRYRRFFSVPIFAVLTLMGFVYYSTVFVFIEDWARLLNSSGFMHTLGFTFLASICLFSFSVCVLTDPGHVPASYVPDVEDGAASNQEFKKDDDSRHCEKCSTYKPQRAHHCRVCRRCVLRMDHHCLWINNCVGYCNYKAFFVLVFYATMTSLYSTVIIICSACQKDQNYRRQFSLKLFYYLFGAMMLALSVTLGTFLGWHVYLTAHNMTTIEYYEGIRAKWMARKSGQNYRHPFDLGVYKNMTLILGPNMLKWLSPSSLSHLKDGTSFPTLCDKRRTRVSPFALVGTILVELDSTFGSFGTGLNFLLLLFTCNILLSLCVIAQQTHPRTSVFGLCALTCGICRLLAAMIFRPTQSMERR